MAVTTDSALYDKLHVKKYLADARDSGGRVVFIPFEVTMRASGAADDIYNLCKIPANWEVLDVFAITPDGLGTTVSGAIGDLGEGGTADPDRYVVATTLAAANNNVRLNNGVGMRYRTPADATVQLTISGAAPTAGRVLKGYVACNVGPGV